MEIYVPILARFFIFYLPAVRKIFYFLVDSEFKIYYLMGDGYNAKWYSKHDKDIIIYTSLMELLFTQQVIIKRVKNHIENIENALDKNTNLSRDLEDILDYTDITEYQDAWEKHKFTLTDLADKLVILKRFMLGRNIICGLLTFYFSYFYLFNLIYYVIEQLI